jgi:phosphopantothenoylcysteine synthetase/decarboxylase
MNTAMWAHPLTRPQVDVLRGLGFPVVPPASKRLACGDVGEGAMAACEDIVSVVKRALRDCAGAHEFM